MEPSAPPPRRTRGSFRTPLLLFTAAAAAAFCIYELYFSIAGAGIVVDIAHFVLFVAAVFSISLAAPRQFWAAALGAVFGQTISLLLHMTQWQLGPLVPILAIPPATILAMSAGGCALLATTIWKRTKKPR